EVVDYTVAPLPAVPAIAGYYQFINRQISDDAADQMDQMQYAASLGEFIDDRFDIGEIAFRRRRVQYLSQQFPLFRWQESSCRVQTAPRGKDSHDFKQIMKCPHCVGLLVLGIANVLLKALNDFGGVEYKRQEFLKLLWRHPILEQFFNKRP